MIAVDASALLAIFLQEDDAEAMEDVLLAAGGGLISAVNYWEVLARALVKFGEPGIELADALVRHMNVGVANVDAELARQAISAFARFRGCPGGRLNLGDCFAYALAAREGDGLLFKGDDFPKTDVKRVLG
jgi:ribonuclease VapC